jgi:hypothetical protein
MSFRVSVSAVTLTALVLFTGCSRSHTRTPMIPTLRQQAVPARPTGAPTTSPAVAATLSVRNLENPQSPAIVLRTGGPQFRLVNGSRLAFTFTGDSRATSVTIVMADTTLTLERHGDLWTGGGRYVQTANPPPADPVLTLEVGTAGNRSTTRFPLNVLHD